MLKRLFRALTERRATDDHFRILADIGRLLRIASEESGLDDASLSGRLTAAGVDPQVAERLVTFVPLAFGRVVLENVGVEGQATYLSRDALGRETRRALRDQAVFRAATDHLADFAEHPGFKELAGRSAEVDALYNALAAGARPEDLTMVEVVITQGPA